MEESPAQKAARLRREKREARIKAGGSARLDKITSLSGRTPPPRDESPSSSNNLTPPSEAENIPSQRSASPLPAPPPNANVQDRSPESLQAQEQYLRTLLRSQQPISPPAAGDEQDPTAKLLGSLLGSTGASTAAAAATTTPGAPPGAPGAGPDLPDLSPASLMSAFGIPSSLANFFMQQKTPESPSVKRTNLIWKTIHILFATVLSFYLLFTLQASISVYGNNPPPPATAQNPFVMLIMGELLLSGTRMVLGKAGGDVQLRSLGPWRRILSDILRDGRLMVFVLGIGSLCGVIGERVKS